MSKELTDKYQQNKATFAKFSKALDTVNSKLHAAVPTFKDYREQAITPDRLQQARKLCLDNLNGIVAKDFLLNASHPINEVKSLQGAIENFWAPLSLALAHMQRRPFVRLAGAYNDKEWVCENGIFTGVFVAPWLGIRPTGGMVALRYGSFQEIKDGQVCSQYILLDLMHFMHQAGISFASENMDSEMRGFFPPPKTQDGLVGKVDEATSIRSKELVEMMISGLLRYRAGEPESMQQEKYWGKQMGWYGSWGIGSTYGLAGFQDFHQMPFLRAFPDRRGGGKHHLYRFSQGNYVASGGAVLATHVGGGFLGMPPTGKSVKMRVMDFWRAGEEENGDYRLQENWVFLDLPHLLLQFGMDVFGRENNLARDPHRRLINV